MTGNFNTTEARALVERLTGFTPGPWTFEMEQDEWPDHALIGGDGDTVLSFDFDLGFSVHDANARLIAAAPDLHRHLAAALDEIERLRLLARRAFLEGHGYARIELGEGTDMDANYRKALLSFASSKTSKALKGDDQ